MILFKGQSACIYWFYAQWRIHFTFVVILNHDRMKLVIYKGWKKFEIGWYHGHV